MSSNINEGTKKRDLLNYTIQRGYSIKVGKVIQNSILHV